MSEMKSSLCLALLLISFFVRAENVEGKSSAQPLSSVRQLIVVTTKDWDSVPGRLRRFERADDHSKWREVGSAFPVVVGRNGLGWGRGLHLSEDAKPPIKKEGDGKSPAGIFRLTSAFGLAEPDQVTWLKLPYRHLSSTIECVDDAKSVYYNSILDRSTVAKVDWDSSEKMRAIGEAYRWGIFIEHNTAPVQPGGGSCVFIHIWKDAKTGTAGCTAMTPEKMDELLHWVDAAKQPTLVQLPESELKRVRKQWGLPKVAAK